MIETKNLRSISVRAPITHDWSLLTALSLTVTKLSPGQGGGAQNFFVGREFANDAVVAALSTYLWAMLLFVWFFGDIKINLNTISVCPVDMLDRTILVTYEKKGFT